MKHWLLITFLVSSFVSCSDTSNKSDSTNPADSARATGGPSTYEDTETSSFQLLKKDSTQGWQYRTDETTYKVVYIALAGKDTQHYIARYRTITNGATGLEGQTRSIQVSLSSLENPAKTRLKAKHDCDELTLNARNFQTVKHGCCGSLDQVKLYDYQNRLIIEGDSKIIPAEVPNQFTFYLSFQAGGSDKTTIGTVHLSYGSNEAYHIQIKSPKPASENCGPVVPALTLRSASKKDSYNEGLNQYDLWSLEHSTSPSQLNNLTIRANFDCDPSLGLIDIPIIKGRPFGKAETNQVYWIQGKSINK
ncbi:MULTISPECIES: hypothetical protein [unclassified Spirosoma]|uniref:hypothetical protein n=1 Tax=unclassified Spirosoma TaxID=2621999 RepID=UPI00095B4F80|nr:MULTISPECIES: hypothetical protein [unclassified Spirosoma]MBN8824864.1 hypothetical protein [Spirosoma sp.]OJW74808.1 MAG: hypothetical protein BGO59_28685 [Spirosoma sp. 48-14]